jgi:hypothetical protein
MSGSKAATVAAAGDIIMFWALVGIGIAGAVAGTTTKVPVIAVMSALLVLAAPLVLTLAGHSVLTIVAFTLGSVIILQTCYLLGVFCGMRFKSPSAARDELPQSSR